MASTAHGSAGVRLIGINPDAEKNITNVHQSMVKGSYFNSIKSKPAIIGEKLAEIYIGGLFDIGAIENWFAYFMALVFLLFRPQGLFGEKIIERV